MRNDSFVYTRREFLQTAALASMMAAMPSFLVEAAQAGAGSAALGERILVVVQLGGGNDGLNTVVPLGNDHYHRARPRLGLAADKVFALNDKLALNNALAPLRSIYDDGRMAIVNGVGYPNPNRSHFRSMEIWQTASDADRYLSTGWAGRYFHNCCNGAPEPLVGVNVGGETPQAFANTVGAGISFPDPEQFRWIEGPGNNRRKAFEMLNHLDSAAAQKAPATTLDFLRQTTANAVASSDRVRAASSRERRSAEYPNTRLARQLRQIAGLIDAGISTRIYYTSIAGFDTHAGQAGSHATLLTQFADAMAAFQSDLAAIGAQDRVTTMCFSEFGRRVAENGSGGTDHGTAGPLFLFGNKLTPGLHGEYPDLGDLESGDLKHTVDFRSVYTELLERCLDADAARILGKKFDSIGVMA